MGIEINKLQDLCSICEYKVESGGEKVPRTIFAAVDEEENAYFGGKLGIQIKQLTVEIVRECLQPIPDEEIYPDFPTTGLTAAPDDCSGLYVKRTDWSSYPDFKGTTFIPRLMLQEAQTMEILAQRPHPNIVRYYGCLVKRGRIAGLVLETFSFPHDMAFTKQRPDLFKGLVDKGRIMAGLRSAVGHLHSMGWAHNDINPANIMLKEQGEPVLIDFGSCQPVGHRLMSCGTAGWRETDFYTSETSHDDYSLGVLEKWLDDLIAREQL